MEFPRAERKPWLFLIIGHKKVCFHGGPESDWGKKQKTKTWCHKWKVKAEGVTEGDQQEVVFCGCDQLDSTVHMLQPADGGH